MPRLENLLSISINFPLAGNLPSLPATQSTPPLLNTTVFVLFVLIVSFYLMQYSFEYLEYLESSVILPVFYQILPCHYFYPSYCVTEK